MAEYFSICSTILSNIQTSPFGIIISLCLISIAYFYLTGRKRRKIDELFRLDPSLEKQMISFRSQSTKLHFHFITLSNKNDIYKAIRISSFNKTYNIKGSKELIIDYKDNQYPFKYDIAEEISLYAEKMKKTFVIVVNKYVENHYNVILDVFENKKSYSLEIIIYSIIKKCLDEINKLQDLIVYKKENTLPNILRLNIINAREEDLKAIYSFKMEKKEKDKINNDFFSEFGENLLLNIIYSKDEKIAFRRVFENTHEKFILNFDNDDNKLLKDLYNNIIKKYINIDPDTPQLDRIL